ncbi:hypothetical protein [Celeribacter baekdonensis]|uniref:Uncharacterized protein n=1 Tax=Celeribacter baekdonensis TaxID=875171 RepID=A0A2R4M764_9RHOB|nr:hypothetical protein [Celeribacter baekdonensis]AVW93015.1 hypothetical protein DA792_19600 [Celeribacter baekdonensis]
MFWPANDENIIPFHMVSEVMGNFGRDVIIRKMTIEGQLTASTRTWSERCLTSGIVAREESALFVRDFMHICVLAKLLAAYPATLYSPTGNKMKVSEHFFYHGDGLDWVALQFPLDEQSELENLFRLAAKNRLTHAALADRFCFINPMFGTIEIKNNSETLCQDFGDSPRDRNKLITLVSEFKGWSLFWNDDELPTPLEWANRLFPSREFDWKWDEFFSHDTTKQSRLEQVLDEVLQVYPNGKTDSWELVDKRTGHSRRQIMRALEALGRLDWKDRSGRE